MFLWPNKYVIILYVNSHNFLMKNGRNFSVRISSFFGSAKPLHIVLDSQDYHTLIFVGFAEEQALISEQ